MQGKKELIVGGFQFGTSKDAAIAQKEVKKIELLESRMDYSNPEQVYLIYESAIQNRVFDTPIGYNYLHALQEYLIEHPIDEKEVISIPLYMNYSQAMREKTEPAKKRVEPQKQKSKSKSIECKLKSSIIINIILVIMVAAMFIITLTGKNPNIINYKNTLVNKYASWEQELTERERIVREKERELNLSEE